METTLPTSTALEQANPIRLLAHVKPEALPFLREHGCTVQPQQNNDLVIFPTDSRQEQLSQTSKRCSNIILPDSTVITAMDCNTRSNTNLHSIVPMCRRRACLVAPLAGARLHNCSCFNCLTERKSVYLTFGRSLNRTYDTPDTLGANRITTARDGVWVGPLAQYISF